MSRCFAILFFVLVAAAQSWSQVLPKEGSVLNYRLIGFSFSPGQQAGMQKIEIAVGHYMSEDSFKKNIVVSTPFSKDTKIINEVPFFGRQYTWRVVREGEKPSRGNLHHFSTSVVPEVDSLHFRLRVLKEAEKYQDAYVFLDGARALYDMNGRAVWYLPDVDGHRIDRSLKDLKITPQGTITFLFEEQAAYEINYNGDILWKAPNDGKVSGLDNECYHHEFTRLDNGHYMALGSEYMLWNKSTPPAADSNFLLRHTNKKQRDSAGLMYSCAPYGTLAEYDEYGNVVWSWKSSEYFKRSDIYYHKAKGRPDASVHANSFYFDEKEGVIYVGFRNISRVLKVKYPEGTVLASYGEIYMPGMPELGNGLFCRQHSVRRSDRGYLYLFNNNVCIKTSSLPQILKLEEPASGYDLKKIWEYTCTAEDVGPDQQGMLMFPTGGNVVELPDHSLFVNMSTAYSKVFILDEDKKVLWSAIPEKWIESSKRWLMVYDYRASMITSRKELEKLIWNAETKE